MREGKREEGRKGSKGGREGKQASKREREREILQLYVVYIASLRREFIFLCGFTIDWILLIVQVISDNFHVR